MGAQTQTRSWLDNVSVRKFNKISWPVKTMPKSYGSASSARPLAGIFSIVTRVKNLCASILIIINGYWCWHNSRLIYWYHFTDLDFVFQYPTWILLVNIIVALGGLGIGLMVFNAKLSCQKGVIINLVSLALTITLREIYIII